MKYLFESREYEKQTRAGRMNMKNSLTYPVHDFFTYSQDESRLIEISEREWYNLFLSGSIV